MSGLGNLDYLVLMMALMVLMLCLMDLGGSCVGICSCLLTPPTAVPMMLETCQRWNKPAIWLL